MAQRAEIRTPLPRDGRVHRVGKIRAGIKKQGTKDGRAIEYPSAVDHFVVNADAATSQQSADSFHKVYGHEPRSLYVTLPGVTPEDVLVSAWRMYGSGALLKRKCEGPGGTCQERGPDGEWVYGPCACTREKRDRDDKTNHCQPRWTLNVLLMNVEGLGVWQFDTGSPMAGDRMAGMLRLLYDLRGTLLRAECVLRLVPVQVAPGGRPKTVYIAQLESSGMTPQQALDQAAGEPLGELPPSTLDEGPDDLLDAVEATPTSIAPPVASPSQQLKNLSLSNRGELYRLAGIPRGSKADVVNGLLAAAWDECGLPDYGDHPLEIAELLYALRERERETMPADAVEEFQRFADTGEDTDPGQQTTIGGEK